MSKTFAKNQVTCPGCGGEMIQKSKVRLIIVGLGMIASLGIAIFVPLFWAPGIVLALAGFYLLAWATLGKALWCRHCKQFSILG